MRKTACSKPMAYQANGDARGTACHKAAVTGGSEGRHGLLVRIALTATRPREKGSNLKPMGSRIQQWQAYQVATLRFCCVSHAQLAVMSPDKTLSVASALPAQKARVTQVGSNAAHQPHFSTRHNRKHRNLWKIRPAVLPGMVSRPLQT